MMLSTVLLAFLSTCFCRLPPIHLWNTPPPQQDADDIIDTMIENFRKLVFERNLDPMMMESPFSTDNFDGFLKEHFPILHVPLSIAGFSVGELDVSKEHE